MAALGEHAAAPIRTPDQRLRVFVSSTLEDLAPERAAAREAIERLRLTPVLFELGARPHPPRALYLAYLQQSDVFVGIYWQRYGWRAPGTDISGLEDEFRAWAAGPRLIYVKSPAVDVEPRLADFLHRLEQDGRVSYRRFRTADELRELLMDDLAVLLSERFSPVASPSRLMEAAPRLPVPLTQLVDRAEELADLSDHLRDRGTRLVTVTGAGGTGKSRLALEVARRLQGDPRFPGGAAFVDLAATREAGRFLGEIARGLGIGQEGDRPIGESVIERLNRRPALVVLDNFEQVATAGPALASLLEACPLTAAMVTSRVPLHVRGEREYRAAPLATPDPDADTDAAQVASSPAVQLFVERAADTCPGFGLTEHNAPVVAEICRRLDGLPLALELAAARVLVHSPEALLDRLRERLDLPAAQADLPERQRTLRATIDWSHALLTPAEQALFARLAIFRGGWTLAAAEAVCGDDDEPDVAETLAALVENSLVVVDAHVGVDPRFGMLQTLHDYAAEQLRSRGEADRLGRRHAEYFTRFSEEAAPHLWSSDQLPWFRRLDADIGNVRAAIGWGLDTGRHELVVRACAGMRVYLWLRDRMQDVAEVLEQVFPLPPETPPATLSDAAWMLGTCRIRTGDNEAARSLFAEALVQARLADDPVRIALALSMLGAMDPGTAGTERAWAQHQEAIAIARRLDWSWGVAYFLNMAGDTAIRERDPAAALQLGSESLAISREIGNEPMAAMALWQVGWAHLRRDDPSRADDALRESAAISLRLKSTENLSYCLDGFAGVAIARGDLETAARLEGAADAARALLRLAAFEPRQAFVEQLRAKARSMLGEERFAAEHARGAAMRAEEAIALVS